jgi:capsid protein
MFELVRGALLSLPSGWDATQFRPEHPATTYPDFKREVLNEAGRGTGAPLNVVSGNSSGYNFSSGRLDHLPYHRGLRVDRQDFQLVVADPVFMAWYDEAIQTDQIPADIASIDEWEWNWNYDGFDSIDQNKDAMADDMRMANGSATYSQVCNDEGDDWQENLAQLAKEVEAFRAVGLKHPYELKTGSVSAPAPAQQPVDQSQPADQTNEDKLRYALAECSVPDHVAELVIAEYLGTPKPPTRPHRNGHANGHYAGGRN